MLDQVLAKAQEACRDENAEAVRGLMALAGARAKRIAATGRQKPIAEPLRRAGEMLAAGELRPGG